MHGLVLGRSAGENQAGKLTKASGRAKSILEIMRQSVHTFGMRISIAILLSCLATTLFAASAPQSVPAEASLCGPFPKYYKEIVYNWMKEALVDADSAKLEWAEDPKPVDIGKNGQHYYGWLVEFKVNARNRFGSYTGKQGHAALIRDNQ